MISTHLIASPSRPGTSLPAPRRRCSGAHSRRARLAPHRTRSELWLAAVATATTTVMVLPTSEELQLVRDRSGTTPTPTSMVPPTYDESHLPPTPTR